MLCAQHLMQKTSVVPSDEWIRFVGRLLNHRQWFRCEVEFILCTTSPFCCNQFQRSSLEVQRQYESQSFLAAWCILMENTLSHSHLCLSGEITYAVYSWYRTIKHISLQILCGKLSNKILIWFRCPSSSIKDNLE